MTTTASAPTPLPPLYVDLDGTLLRTDALWESVAKLLREQPLTLALGAPGWLARGKAGFKAAVADLVELDPASLPYEPEVVAHIAQARNEGRRVVLATASDRRIAQAISDHLGLFDDVLATDGENLSGRAKLAAIESEVAERGAAGFEYIGNAAVDIAIWERASIATLAAPTGAARRWAEGRSPSPQVLAGDGPPLWRALVKQLRPHQWAKNALLFAPLLLAHELADPRRLFSVLIAFAGFCAVASAGYVINDLLDAEADRRHATKRNRPIASGALPIPVALASVAGLLAPAFLLSALLLPAASTGMLAAYLVLTLAYSLYLKRQLLLDVLVLAGLYTHRVLAGGVAAEVPVSPWLLAFSSFFFLSLALVKRYVELLDAREVDRDTIERRAYRVSDIGLVETIGLSCACISVLILCLFVSSEDVTRLYSAPGWLWLMCPVMYFWVSRVWFLARRGQLHDDPVLFAVRDRTSYLCGILLLAIVCTATLGG